MNSLCVSAHPIHREGSPECPQARQEFSQPVSLFLSSPGSPEPSRCLVTMTPLYTLDNRPATGGFSLPPAGQTEATFQGILE